MSLQKQNSFLPDWLSRFDILGLFEKDAFGNSLLFKRILVSLIGLLSYNRLTLINKIEIVGSEHLQELPDERVLFLSNHQTYFADVFALYHVFCAVKWGNVDTLNPPFYLMAPRAQVYYVAASETMRGGIIPKIFTLGGAILVERSWRSLGQNVKRELDNQGQQQIGLGLDSGWVISFPQGTTKPYAPVRKGTAHLIKEYRPIVIPVVIDGFRRAFDKKGLRLKKRNTTLRVRFKAPLSFDPDADIDEMVDSIANAIEQVVEIDVKS